ncbi:NUDIX hydrolase [Salarchaeum japonicum]|uniref:NUDIX domain-containing protein n=1 Tax=Salarchaeum japonicum TaxID=555573 RepID=A0AAV3T3L9_9EURY|nr:NUDIX domain-containing protein [Salarchaeum japonicum]
MDDPEHDVERVLNRLEDVHGEIPVHHESTPVPREMYVECMNAADNGELGGVRVLVSHENEFLLVREDGGDAWDAPGGSLSRNDTHATAGTQHVADQVGIECTVVDAFAAIEREFTLVDGGEGVTGLWVFFEAETFETDIATGPDIEDARWFSRPPTEVGPHLSERLSLAAGDD